MTFEAEIEQPEGTEPVEVASGEIYSPMASNVQLRVAAESP
jgi:hypothetical protein